MTSLNMAPNHSHAEAGAFKITYFSFYRTQLPSTSWKLSRWSALVLFKHHLAAAEVSRFHFTRASHESDCSCSTWLACFVVTLFGRSHFWACCDSFLFLQFIFNFYSFFGNFYFYFLLLCNTVLVLPYIDMNQPRVYMSSQSWTPLTPPTPYHLSESSPCTSPKHPVSCIKHRLAIRFLHDSIHVSMPSPKSSHPLPLPLSPKVHSTHLCLFCCLAYRVIITIFLNSIYIYMLVYCIGVFLSGLLHSV